MAGESSSKGKADKSKLMQPMVLVLIAVLIIAVAAMVFLLSQPSAPEAGAPSFKELIADVKTASIDEKAGTVSLDINISFSMEAGDGFKTDMQVAGIAIIKTDCINKRHYMSFASDFSAYLGIPSNMEVYIIGDEAYTLVEDPYTGQASWIKQTLEQDVCESETFEEAVLNALDGIAFEPTIISTTLDGIDSYLVEGTPDLREVLEPLLMAQLASYASPEEIEAQLDEAMAMLEEALKRFDLQLWVRKDTNMLSRIAADIVLELDEDAMAEIGMQASISISALITADLEYGPVDIILPAAAEDAEDLTTLLANLTDLYAEASPTNDTYY